jgi:hypothetical protein
MAKIRIVVDIDEPGVTRDALLMTIKEMSGNGRRLVDIDGTNGCLPGQVVGVATSWTDGRFSITPLEEA